MQNTTTAQTNSDNEADSTLESIHRLMQDVAETREKVSNLRDQLNDVITQNEEYQALAEEIKTLTKKRSEAKKALQEDNDYQLLSADLDDYRLKLRDLQDILSQHLVLYYNQTQQTKIVDRGGETRSVILSAKVGKAEA